jgi:hypothetical protein
MNELLSSSAGSIITMKRIILSATILAVSSALQGCGDGGPTRPTVTSTTTSAPPVSPFHIETLTTVYQRASADAQWTEGATDEARIGEILLGVDSLTEGTTALNNEEGRVALQQAIDRVREQFSDADYLSAFDETKANLERFLNDADNDGWSIDGRHGEGRDWPHDSNGNDPDGWTAQIVVTVTRR